MKKWIIAIFIFSIGLVLAACGDDSTEESESAEEAPVEQAQEPVEITEEEKVEEDTAVVDVNGTEIKGSKYNPLYSQVKTMNQQYGQDTSDLGQLKEQTISILVEQELIKQDATNKGIEVTDEETQNELDSMIEQVGEEQFQDVLDQTQLTEEEFRNQLKDDLITQKYMDTELEVEVTDEEVKENYDLLKEENEEIGELEEVEGQIRELLAQQEETEQLQAKLDELKENAEIETLI